MTSNINENQRISSKSENQVSTCVSINLNRKTCIENNMESIGTHKHAINTSIHTTITSMDKTSCTSSDYRFTG